MTGLGYAIVGMALGIFMAASHDHGQMVTHAHIMLVGFVVSFIYGFCHKLWLNNSTSKLAVAQYYVHQVGTLFIVMGLFLLYGKFVPLEKNRSVAGSFIHRRLDRDGAHESAVHKGYESVVTSYEDASAQYC